MSWPAVGWALGQRAPSSASKFLLVMLADSASAGDWLAWPSVAYLSEATQQDRKTVLANLQKLQQNRLIEPAGKTGRTGQIAIWRLAVTTSSQPAKSPKSGTLTDAETVPIFPPNSTGFPAEQYQKRDTEPVIEPVNEPKRKNARKRAASPDDSVSADLLIAAGFDGKTAAEFVAYKVAKKAPLTARAWADHLRESQKAGWPPMAAAEKAMAKSWKGFEAKYVADDQRTGRASAAPNPFDGSL